ncbi:MAG: rhomboid family intramembrane serine protease [Anaerolineae bacterium]
MLPLNAMRRNRGTPYVTYLLLFANILVFLWELTLSPSALGQAFYSLALVPCDVGSLPIYEVVLDAFRSMFFHGSWLHLLGNMLFLVIFGVHVEEYFGSKMFLFFYIVAGFGSALLHTLINAGQCTLFGGGAVPVIGASGAIAGVMGAFLLLYPGVRIRTITLFNRLPIGTAKINALVYLGLYFVMDVIDGLLPFFDLPATRPGVAVWGHIGGFLVGLLFTFVATMFKAAPKVDPLSHLDE